MHVIATAGHVDHGKSALLKALTGMEPDRWEEERRRGLTIDLGFVWTRGAHGPVAFVDVPGHERFVGNMLAGVGPVPAVLFVVAADEGWMPQSEEHLVALDALGVRDGLLVITKTDVMEPELAAEEALERLRGTSLAGVGWLGVSARSSEGLDKLRTALDDLVAGLPPGDTAAPVRLWVDRGFTIHGAGLVVTGTLAAGTIRNGDTLELAGTQKRYVVREMQALNEHVASVCGVSRVALNLRGAHRGEIRRGDALMTPGTYRSTSAVDIRTRLCAPADLPADLLVHVGAATVDAHLRPLGPDTARLTLGSPLPLRAGDRLVLRPSSGVAGGAVVLDADPPRLGRRGSARARAAALGEYSEIPDATAELRRRGIIRQDALRVMGFTPPIEPLAADWLVDPALEASLRARLASLTGADPVKVEDARKALQLPDARLVAPLLGPGLAIRDGMVVRAGATDTLTPVVRQALSELEARSPGFTAFSDPDLTGHGLGPAEIAAAVRNGRMVRLAPDVVLLATAVEAALTVFATLPQPFTVSEAREALHTNRKVIVPLLEHLALKGKTRRDPDARHRLFSR
ncbi:MAG TPA: selenocysteine-specific translation elongation factor [Candidatus Limnocylindrales bacterium]|nr:selenocysteine-specific translation elongation factor [Candidatus Limnocylindrales bacterium]